MLSRYYLAFDDVEIHIPHPDRPFDGLLCDLAIMDRERVELIFPKRSVPRGRVDKEHEVGSGFFAESRTLADEAVKAILRTIKEMEVPSYGDVDEFRKRFDLSPLAYDEGETGLYFAYGSNMDEEQMSRRCSWFEPRGFARLPGYRLAFDIPGTVFADRVANLREDPRSEVWGRVWEVPIDEFRDRMDFYEGAWEAKGGCWDVLANEYEQVRRTPRPEGEYQRYTEEVSVGDTREEVELYRTPRDRGGKEGAPSDVYRDRILKALRDGAEEGVVPASYVEDVERLSSKGR